MAEQSKAAVSTHIKRFQLTNETSWSANVDQAVSKSLSKEGIKRQEAIFELIATESRYVRSLQILFEIFYPALKSVLSEKELTLVFSNVEDILLCNVQLLADLEDRQSLEMPIVSKIGDVISKHVC